MSSEPEPAPDSGEGKLPPAGSAVGELAQISLEGFPLSVREEFQRLIRELEFRRGEHEEAPE